MSRYAKLGDLIASTRVREGFPQQSDFAEALQVSQQTVSRWERGDTRPQKNLLKSLSMLLRLDINQLMQVGEYSSSEASDGSVTVAFDKPFPVDALTAEGFERFCLYVLRDLYPDAEVNRMGGTGHAQQGLDITARFPGGSLIGYQCKHVEKFGAAKVHAAVAAHKFPSEENVLILSKVASPAARHALRQHQGWKLWDKEDLSTIIRTKLSKTQQRRLVDTFFKGQHLALLGETSDGPWENLEQFFAPYDDMNAAFNQKWPLVGRQHDRDLLVDSLNSSSELAVILLTGSGGAGKSKLLKEIATKCSIKYSTSAYQFLSASSEATISDLKQLPDGHKIIFVDDAHEHDLSALLRFTSSTENNCKLLLTCRPYMIELIRAQAATAGIAPTRLYEHKISALTLPETASLASQVLSNFGGPEAIAEIIAKQTLDCPLAAVLASYVVSTEGVPLERVKSAGYFRDIMRGKFMTTLAGTVAGAFDTPLYKKLLTVLALIQPFELDDEHIPHLVERVEQISVPETNRLLRVLSSTGLLHKRGRQCRLSPEMIADFLIEESCVGPGGVSTGYAEKVFDATDKVHLLENLLFNIGKLDWRLTDGDPHDSKLLDFLWKQFTSKHTSPPVKAVTSIAFFQPTRALEFAENLIRQNRCLDQLPPLLRNVAGNIQFLKRACEGLWELGKNDPRELNQHPTHAIRILSELASVEFSSDLKFIKSLRCNDIVLDYALDLLQYDQNFDTIHNPFEILSGLLKTEGRFARSEGKEWSLIQYAVPPEPDILELRARAIDAAISLLDSINQKKAFAAANFLRKAFQRPVSGRFSKEWNSEFTQTMRKLLLKFSENPPIPVVCIEIMNTLRWFSHAGSDEQKQIVADICSLLPQTLDFRCTNALLSGVENMIEKAVDGTYQLSLSYRNLINELLSSFPDPQDLSCYLSALVESMGCRTRGTEADYYPFINHVIRRSDALARTIVQNAKSQRDNFSSKFAGLALTTIFDSNRSEAFSLASELAYSNEKYLQVAVAEAYTWFRPQQGLSQCDITLLSHLIRTEDRTIVGRVLNCLRMLSIAKDRNAIDLARQINFKALGELAANVFDILSEPNLLNQFTQEDCKFFLSCLIDVRDLDDHGIESFLAYFSKVEPLEVAKFFMARVDYAVRNKDWSYDTCFNPFTDHVQLKFRSVEEFPAVQQMVFDWIKRSKDSMFRYKAAQVFALFFAPFDEEILHFLTEWLIYSDKEDMEFLVQLMGEAPEDFVLENPSFVVTFLERARSFGKDLEKRSMQALYRSAMRGIRSGLVGQPFPKDLELRLRTCTIQEQISRYSLAFEFYSNLKKYAEDEIQASIEPPDVF